MMKKKTCRTRIQPGKPLQNAYMERLNKYHREDIFDAYWFNNLHQIRKLNYKWMENGHTKHEHSALGSIPPRE
ncbi:integrase core domain-containing protein [Croceitalea sp. MTPC5]|uniref:integrase core domain-containing protein n=1 Tax=Croceitalea sp. MTPC5 TaxID=3056565 RepID=UPI0030D40DF9